MGVKSRLKAIWRSHWPMPMATVLALSFGTLVAFAVAVVLVMSVQANFRNTFALLNDKSVLLVDSLRDGIKGHLQPAEYMIRGLADLRIRQKSTHGGRSCSENRNEKAQGQRNNGSLPGGAEKSLPDTRGAGAAHDRPAEGLCDRSRPTKNRGVSKS